MRCDTMSGGCESTEDGKKYTITLSKDKRIIPARTIKLGCACVPGATTPLLPHSDRRG